MGDASITPLPIRSILPGRFVQGLLASIQGVKGRSSSGVINVTEDSRVSPPDSTISHQLQFMVAPMPSGLISGGFANWIGKYVRKLVAGFYDAVLDVAKTLSDALCAMAQTPGSVEAAAAAGGPAAAAGAAGTKLLLGGKCGQQLPPSAGEPPKPGWLLPVAIGGAILAVGLLLPKKRKAP
mgnify:CR=1 FL=1